MVLHYTDSKCLYKPIPNLLYCFNPITHFYLPKDCCQTLPGNPGVGSLTIIKTNSSITVCHPTFSMNQLWLEVWMTPNGLHNTHLTKFAASLPVFPTSLLLETRPTRPKFSIVFSLLCFSLICSIIVGTHNIRFLPTPQLSHYLNCALKNSYQNSISLLFVPCH